MIRFMNLGATLALNMSDYERGMKKAAELTAKAEESILKMRDTSEKAQAKLANLQDQRAQKEKEVGDAIIAEEQKVQQKISDIRNKTAAKNKKDAERLNFVKADIEKAVEIERRYAARVKETDRQLSDDRIAEIRRISDQRIASANKERTELLRIAKLSVVELTAVDKTREQALKRERTGLRGQLSSERRRSESIVESLGALAVSQANIRSSKPTEATTKLFLESQLQQGRLREELAKSQRLQGSLRQRISNKGSQIDTLGIEDGIKNRIFQLDKQVSIATDEIVNKHVDKWKEKQTSLIGQIQTNKEKYLEKNANKIREINEKLQTLGSGVETDGLVKQIQSLEKQKDSYIKRKTAELKRAENVLMKGESEAMHAATAYSAASDRGPNLQSSIDKQHGTLANRAAVSDTIGSQFIFGGAAIGGGLAAMVKSGAEISRSYLRELHSTSISTVEESQKMFNAITEGALKTGKTTDDLAKSYREIENIVDKNSVIPVFNAALKASVATGTDLSEIAVTLAKSISIFGGSAEDASRYVNTLAKAAAISALDMKQLSHIVGQSFGLAKAAGVGFVDTTTALTVFTKAGLDATQSATQFKNGLIKLINPSKDVQKELGRLKDRTGVDLQKTFTLSNIKQNGIVSAFEEIRKVAKLTGQDFEKLAFQLFPNLRGTLFGITLASEEGFQRFKTLSEGLNKTFRDNEDFLSGKYNETIKDSSTQIDILARNFEVLTLEIAKAATPSLLELVKGVSSAVSWFTKLDSSTKENIVNTVKYISIGSLLIGAGFKVASMYYALRAAILGVAAAQQILTAASGEAGVAGAFSKLAPLLAAVKNPWVLLATAVGITTVGAYTYFSQASQRAKDALEAETKAKKEATDKAISLGKANFDAYNKSKDLFNQVLDLNTNTQKTKELEEERLSLLTQISRLTPDLVTGYNSQHQAIGLVADAYERLNKGMKENNFNIFAGERQKRRREIVEAQSDPILQQQKKRISFIESLDKDKLNSITSSESAAGMPVDKTEGIFQALINATGKKRSAFFGYTTDQLIEQLKKEIGGLKNLKSEVESKERAIIELRDALGKAEAQWHDQLTKGEKVGSVTVDKIDPNKPKPVIIDPEQYKADQEARLQRIRSISESLFSKYKEMQERIYVKMHGDSEQSKGEFLKNFLNDDLFKEEQKGISGTPEEQIRKWTARAEKIGKLLPSLGKNLDFLLKDEQEDKNKKSISEQLNVRINELLAELDNVAGAREKSAVEKLNIWLKEKDLKTGFLNKDVADPKEIKRALDLATKYDKGVIDAKVGKGREDISVLLRTFFQNKKEGEQVYNGIMEVFEKNPALKAEYGAWGEFFARVAQGMYNAKEKAKEVIDYTRELKKKISQLENPIGDLDRVTAELTSGKFDNFDEFIKSLSTPQAQTEISEFIKRLSALEKQAKTADHTFDDLETRISKVRGKIGLLSAQDGSFEDWFGKNFGDANAPANKKNQLEELFQLDTVFEKLTKIKEKLTSLRKKEGEEDAFNFDKSGTLKKLDEEIKAVEKYESRLKAFESSFKSIFSSAFEGVLNKSGNFWKGMREGVKSLFVKTATDQFTNGIFEALKQGAERIFPGLKKPEFSKQSLDIIKNPAGFLKEWENIMFNKNNVMQVSMVNTPSSARDGIFGSAPESSKSPIPYPEDQDKADPQSRNKSGLPSWLTAKNVGTAYAISKSKAGQEVTGFGTLLKGAAGIKGISPAFAKGLGVAGGILTTVGVGLAINDLLGNPLGKLKKKIFGRATKGPMIPGNAYVTGEDGPELIVPDVAGMVRPMRNGEEMPGLIIQGDLHVSTPRDAEKMGREFARIQRVSQGISGQLQRRRATT